MTQLTTPKVFGIDDLIRYAAKYPKKCVYIAGPMDKVEHDNFPAFDALAAMLQAARVEFVNPADIAKIFPGRSREFYMQRDIAKLTGHCHVVWLLPDWRKSEGAQFEALTAQVCGMQAVEIDPVGHPELLPVWKEKKDG